MALTVLLALAGSLVLSMTLMPALAATGLPKRPSKDDVWFLQWLKKIYAPLVAVAVARPVGTTL